MFPRAVRAGVLGLVLLAFVAPWWNLPLDNADSAGMLAHLHAFFVAGDLLYDDEYAQLGVSGLFAFVTAEGVVSNHWPIGATWIQAPGFGLSVLVGKLLQVLDLPGARAPWTVWLLGLHVWAMLLLAWLARELARWFGGRSGVAYAACIVVGTPLLYYASEAPARPHLWGACVVFVLVRIWQGQWGSASMGRTVCLGLLVGLAASIRPQLAPLGLIVLHDAWAEKDRLRHVVVGVVSCSAWPLANLGFQWWMYGQNLAGYFGGEVSHHPRHLLFSPYHGLTTWSPLLWLGIAGLVVGTWERRRGAWLVLLLVLGQLWVDSGYRAIAPGEVLGTRTWGGGTSFGPRKLVEVLPLFVLGLMWLRDAARVRDRAGWCLGAVIGLSLPIAWLHLSVWIDPSGAERVLGWDEYRALFLVPLDAGAWQVASGQRALPISLSLTMLGGVAIPLVLASAVVLGRARRASVRATVAVLLGTCVLAHVWLAGLKARSDARLEQAPERMVEVGRRLQPRHLATVFLTGQHREQVRARLGDDAAPP